MHPTNRPVVHPVLAHVANLELGSFQPAALAPAREQLHQALQLVAAAARSFASPLPDDALANLSWNSEHYAFVSRQLGTHERAPHVGLRMDRPMLLLLDEHQNVLFELAITGRVRTEMAGWLRAQLALRDLSAARYQLDKPYELPPHPVADGSRYFEPNDVAPGTPAELAHWYSLAHAALDQVRQAQADASPLRCWPHHFDLATLVPVPVLAPSGSAEDSSVGVGFSPGDEGIEQPYFYVTPWPAPASDAALPDLPLGHWHTEGWTGAVLLADELLTAAAPTTPSETPAAAESDSPASSSVPIRAPVGDAADCLRTFLEAAVPAARSLLEQIRS